MTDQELRDKLASKYWQDFYGSQTHEESFKAGWDAARANDTQKQQIKQQAENIEELVKELEACKLEYANYIAGRPGSWYVTQLQQERDALLAENSKLRQKTIDKSVEANEYQRAAHFALNEQFNQKVSDELTLKTKQLAIAIQALETLAVEAQVGKHLLLASNTIIYKNKAAEALQQIKETK